MPAVTGVREEASASVKCKKIPAHPQISPSSPFDSAASKFAKPSALRMPSPSVGFFNQVVYFVLPFLEHCLICCGVMHWCISYFLKNIMISWLDSKFEK